jgi:membrane protease YdiL (CAAX protease family)
VIIKKVEDLKEGLSFKFILTITLLYFLVVFPAIHFFLRGHPWLPQYGYALYFAGIFTYVLGVKKIPSSELGFSRQHLGNHLLIGSILAGLIVSALPLLDALVSLSGLEQNELFSEAANQRNADDWNNLHPFDLAARILIIPFLVQFFFTGMIFQSLNRKYTHALAIYGSGVLFTLGHFKLNLGLLFLGVISAYLFRLTGTLYASILFHASCSLAGILLLYIYPRLITLLGFLF